MKSIFCHFENKRVLYFPRILKLENSALSYRVLAIVTFIATDVVTNDLIWPHELKYQTLVDENIVSHVTLSPHEAKVDKVTISPTFYMEFFCTFKVRSLPQESCV
jgi:hypothetical protein